MKALSNLKTLIETVPAKLRNLPADTVAGKTAPSKWSAKEELGHLLDSAANNHQRIVRAQFEDKLAMTGYDQTKWVAVHKYQNRDWAGLIDLWTALNRQLLAAAESVPDSAWKHTLTVAGSAPMTLQFVFEDYIAHMVHHLEHIGIKARDAASN